jgi:esterase/lipase superfamily enzyme
VYLIAHSMGNRVLTGAFKDLLTEDLTRRRAFREIVLTAPDIDADVFKKQLAPAILGRGPRVTLYASSQDVALAGSRKVHGYRRLGETGSELTVLPDMDTVDASNVKTDFLAHSYFGDSRTVMADLFYLIRKRLKPDERFALEPVHSTGGDYWRFKR